MRMTLDEPISHSSFSSVLSLVAVPVLTQTDLQNPDLFMRGQCNGPPFPMWSEVLSQNTIFTPLTHSEIKGTFIYTEPSFLEREIIIIFIYHHHRLSIHIMCFSLSFFLSEQSKRQHKMPLWPSFGSHASQFCHVQMVV